MYVQKGGLWYKVCGEEIYFIEIQISQWEYM